MNSALDHYRQAIDYLKREQHEAAIAELKQSLAIYPDHRDAIFNLGYCHLTMNNYKEALEQFRLLLQIDPNDALAYQSIGKLFRQKAQSSHSLQDWKSAQEAFQRSLVLNPNDANALDELAIVLYELGEFGDALTTSMAAAATAAKDRRISHNTGAIGGKILRKCISNGKWKEAWQYWRMSFKSHKVGAENSRIS